ncbi:methyltransferase domain-containing protein [Colletotrichum navitas]|uniref:Methyltransferase domain-containing protein n=1 Tax=Colletotrichum navitas TaxID=681940 RepID=A0AAD8V324_9PEZI|nr:methyltransferase domain-containing protein [Colletotrichum navitas]KAK1585428.1 methyltransferase domain-containing protein [Colletotrichum navitas]
MASTPAEIEPTADPIHADPAVEDDYDPDEIQSLLTSSTASVTDSVREYRQLHGRTYTQKTDYFAPNDDQQNDALDFNHYWVTDFLGDRLFVAPIGDNPQKVLDLGTGTGIWAIDFADRFPSADVIGIDISPIQPLWVPPNCRFQIDDFEKPWTFSYPFDFIHARNLEGCIADLPNFFKQIYDNTRPGGWFEIIEFDPEARSQRLGELGEDHIFKRWYSYLEIASTKMGKPHGNAANRRLAKGLREAGFVDIVELKWTIPIGAWPAKPDMKQLGICNLEYIEQALEGFGLFLLKEALGFSYEEVQVTLAEMRSALRNPRNMPFYYMHAVYARKPGKGQGSVPAAA